mmetsp:Transcript_9939/g.24310  ORF Transcript_9939/g.24310 Transcript_9939/m.24310 type:complete len:81 (-) Transcript_9939:63-305(-)
MNNIPRGIDLVAGRNLIRAGNKNHHSIWSRFGANFFVVKVISCQFIFGFKCNWGTWGCSSYHYLDEFFLLGRIKAVDCSS